MTKRAAIYTRFSSDLQNPKSCDDQEAMARAFARREGYQVAQVYSDAAVSGQSLIGRDGLQDLLADAKAGQFDFVLVEEIDRLSRDQADMQFINKRLKFAGVQIVTMSSGIANDITITVRGLVAQLQSQDIGPKVRRAAAGRVSEGKIPAGVSYGYRKDTSAPGRASIDETEAEIVRRIYADTIRGLSPNRIASELNAEAVPAPRGGQHWLATTIRGWEKRGTGILRNPIYTGRIIYNRQRWIKDPETGRRVSRLNDAALQNTCQIDSLRILDQEIFDDVQRMLQDNAYSPRKAGAQKRPKRLLSGLLRCGACGGGMSAYGGDKFGRIRVVCSRHRDGKPCPAPHTFRLDKIDALVVKSLREGLQHPEILAEYVKAYNDERIRLSREASAGRIKLEKRAATLDAQIVRILRCLREGIGNERRLGEEMNDLQAELDQVNAELQATPPDDIVTLHPKVIDRYAAQLLDLQAAVEAGLSNTPANAALLRELLHSVVVSSTGVAGEVSVTIQGNLRLLLNEKPRPEPGLCGILVAGARFELTTFRL